MLDSWHARARNSPGISIMTRRLLFFFLLVLLVSTTFGLDIDLAPGVSVKNIFLYILVFAITIENTVFRSWRFGLPSVLIPLIIFSGYCVLSWFAATFVVQPDYYEPLESFIRLKNARIDYLLIFLLFFLGPKTTDEARKLLHAFLWMIVIGNLLTVVDGFNIPDLGIIIQGENGRLGGPIGEYNQYGALLAVTLPGVIALYWDTSRTSRSLVLAAGVISVLALLATGSRGAIFGILCGCMWSMFFLRETIPFRKAAAGTLVAIALLTIIVAASLTTDLFSHVLSDFVERSTSGNVNDLSANRTAIWQMALERMMQQPVSFVIGFGWDAEDHMFFKSPHNQYLGIMFNLGIVGLCFYLVLIYNIFIGCRRAIRKAEPVVRLHLSAFVFGFASLCINNFFIDLYSPWLFVWAYVGLAMNWTYQTLRTSTNAAGSPVPRKN